MADKQIINTCEFFNICESACGGTLEDTEMCSCYGLYKQLKAKEQECEELKKYLNQIRDEELSHLDIEWDEYETSARQEDYSNIITLVERALGEIDD